MVKISLQVFMIAFILAQNAMAASEIKIPVTGRLFIGNLSVSPTNLNQEMTAQSLNSIDTPSVMGIEITRPILSQLDFGFRYTKRSAVKQEIIDNPNTPFQGELSQDSILVLVRVPFYKSTYVHADIFAGVGGSNTTFKMKSATQDGELSRAESGDWFATPYGSAGASVAVGYDKFYFVIEAGYEANKVDSLKRSGNINSNINTIDLTGSYLTVGLLFDGVPGTIK